LSSYGKTLVYADALRRLEDNKNMITRRINDGASPDSELLLINARLSQAQIDYSTSLALQNKTLVTLEQLLAKKVTIEEFRDILPKELNKLELTSKYSDGDLMNKVIEVNPSLEKYSGQIKAQSYEIDIKKAVLYPTIYTKYEKNWSDSNNTSNNNNDSLFKIGVEYSPGAGLSSLSAIDSAKADLLTLSRDRENMELELKQKINSELSDYEFTYNRYDNYTLAVESNRQTQESYKRLFIAGKRSWLDVLNAERELINSQISLSDVQAYLVTTPIRFKIFSNELLKLKKDNNEY
jgi:outer membrane protein, adhesin transport system